MRSSPEQADEQINQVTELKQILSDKDSACQRYLSRIEELKLLLRKSNKESTSAAPRVRHMATEMEQFKGTTSWLNRCKIFRDVTDSRRALFQSFIRSIDKTEKM